MGANTQERRVIIKGFRDMGDHVEAVTALQLLLEGDQRAALDLLERLRREVNVGPGAPIPFERLPVMPAREKREAFAQAWHIDRKSIAPELTARVDALEPWLRDVGALPPEQP